jgi:hypothetical protein
VFRCPGLRDRKGKHILPYPADHCIGIGLLGSGKHDGKAFGFDLKGSCSQHDQFIREMQVNRAAALAAAAMEVPRVPMRATARQGRCEWCPREGNSLCEPKQQ